MPLYKAPPVLEEPAPEEPTDIVRYMEGNQQVVGQTTQVAAGLSFSPTEAGTYLIEGWLLFSSNNSENGLTLLPAFTGTAPAQKAFQMRAGHLNNTQLYFSSSGGIVSTAPPVAVNTAYLVRVEYLVIWNTTPATGTALTLSFANETTTATTTLLAGSTLVVRKVA